MSSNNKWLANSWLHRSWRISWHSYLKGPMKDAKQGAGSAGKQIMAVHSDILSKTCGALVLWVAEGWAPGCPEAATERYQDSVQDPLPRRNLKIFSASPLGGISLAWSAWCHFWILALVLLGMGNMAQLKKQAHESKYPQFVCCHQCLFTSLGCLKKVAVGRCHPLLVVQ